MATPAAPALLEAVRTAVNTARYDRDEFADVTVLHGAAVDLIAGTAAAVLTILGSQWAALAWIGVAVLACKTLVQTAVALIGDRGAG